LTGLSDGLDGALHFRRVSLEKGGVRPGIKSGKMEKRALSGREKDPSRRIAVVYCSVV
jgi:hypothetical protein